MPSCTAGMGHAADSLKDDLKRAVHEHFPDTDALAKYLEHLRGKYKKHPAGLSYIDDLIAKKAKLCVTHTRTKHTLGHTATVRVENMNSTMKVGGGRGDEMDKYNMSDLFNMYCSWESNMAQVATAKITTLLEADCKETPWGPWVQQKWDMSRSLSSKVVKVRH